MANIAFLSEHASPLALRGGADSGGQNVYVSELCQQLADAGYQVDVFTRREKLDEPEIVNWRPGIRVIAIEAGPVTLLQKDLLWPYMSVFRDGILAFIAREHCHYELIHSNFWMSGWVAVELKRRLSLPVVHIFHAMGKTKQSNQGSMDTSPKDRLAVEQYVINGVDCIIAQCPAEHHELVVDYGAPEQKVVVIPSAVNTDVFSPVPCDEARLRLGLSLDDFIVGYVGRLLPRKDVRNVVRGVAQFIDLVRKEQPQKSLAIRMLIVGGESEVPSPQYTPEIGILQALADELYIGGTLCFTGKRQQDTLRYYYSAADVVVTTPWYEPFGLTPLEGMACGRPVIGSAVGGITYTIQDGVTGLLVPPRDPIALAHKLWYLFQMPVSRTGMGLAARKHIEQFFSWSTTAMHTANLYQNVLAETRLFQKIEPYGLS